MSHVLPRIPLRLAPLAAVLLTVAAGPAAALTTGSVELSYATPTRSDFVSITGGGPPEESNPPLPIAATLTTPTPETPGVDDAFIGLHGEVQAEVPSGPGVYVQSVGAGVGGVDFESPFGGTIENTILWSDDPIGDGPFDVSARAVVSQEIRYQLLAEELWVRFEWGGEALFFANNLGAGADYEYGYALTASVFSNVEDGFYGTFPEIGALGGPALTVSRFEVLAPSEEAFPFESATVGVPFFSPFDVGNFFRVRLDLEVWIEGQGFDVDEFALIQNAVDFTGTLGVTSIEGAVLAPEPGATLLAAFALAAGLFVARRRA